MTTATRSVRAAAGAVGAAIALASAGIAWAPSAAAQTAPKAGGFADAKGVIVDLTVLTAVPVPGALGNTPLDPNTFATASQSCPPQAAAIDEEILLSVPASPAVTSATVTAQAGANCKTPESIAFAETEDVKALFSAPTVPLISADVITAQANANCTEAPNGEGSQFTNLVINGTPVPLGPLGVPAPNTRIDIPGIATVIVNEQNPTADGRGIVVNGLHVIGASPLLRGDLIISHAVAGVVCPNGKGSEVAPGLDPPAITFDKDASPSTGKAGDTITYTATVRNTSTEACDVISFVDNLSPAFEFVSTSGDFGNEADDPPLVRSDGGQDIVLRPADVVIAAGGQATQTFVVKLKSGVKPGTYFNNLQIFCAVNGNFASGPVAPVTVPAAARPPAARPPAAAPPAAPAPVQLPRTGGPEWTTPLALALLAGAGGLVVARRRATV